MPQALDGIRVLELSGLCGAYTGKLFADLGAAVTLVEPPSGSPMRNKPPFVGDVAGPENSLPFAYFAANKNGIVLDLETAAGREALADLAAEAHLVILSDHPAADSVDVDELLLANPRLVCTRITPYGSEGPYATYSGDDLTLMAMGGLLTMAGFPGQAPVVAYGEQGLLAGDQFAAVASLAAVIRAERTGEGELIDVSIQEAIVMALENAAQTYQLEGKVRNRTAGTRRAGTGIFQAKDGDIYLLAGGIGDTAMWGNFAQWMAAEGVQGAELFAANDWDDQDPKARDVFDRVFLPFAAGKTKTELYTAAREWRVPMAPMSTAPDLLQDRQLRFRNFFVAAPAGNAAAGILLPGAPYKLAGTPWALLCAAPRLDGADRQTSQFKESAS